LKPIFVDHPGLYLTYFLDLGITLPSNAFISDDSQSIKSCKKWDMAWSEFGARVPDGELLPELALKKLLQHAVETTTYAHSV